MAFVVADRVKETTTTVGTGAVALAGAVTGFRTFASGIGNSNTTYYTIASQTANEWEVGFGTLDATSANLARTTVLASSNGGSLVTFSAGTKDVFVTQSAARTLVQASGGTTTNGVLYYTGSGVAAGGSALTFDGSTLTLGGVFAATRFGINANPINTTSTSQSFARFQTTGADFYIGTESSTAGGFFPGSTAYAAVLYNANSTPMQFYTAAALRMTLDSSGNLGVGTTSPSNLLHIKAATNPVFRLEGATDSGYVDYNGTRLQLSAGGGALYFVAGNAERARIDSSGNLGLGVTPSAWSGYRALQVGGATSIWSTTSGAGSSFYSNNVYFNGSNRIRLNAGYATEYIQDSSAGAHIWYNASSSTAGSTIAFNTLANFSTAIYFYKNLSVGNPITSLWDSNGSVISNSWNALWSPNDYPSQSDYLVNAYYDGTNYVYLNDDTASMYRQYNGAHTWWSAASGFAGDPISPFYQYMTLNVSGNLGLGTTSPGVKLDVNIGGTPPSESAGTVARVVSAGGAGFDAIFGIVGGNAGRSIIDFGDTDSPLPGRIAYEHNNNAFAFTTAATERMRLDTSGNLLVGTTNPLVNPTAGVTITGASATWNIGINHPTGSASGNGYMSFVYNTTQIGSITQSGTTAVLYNVTSDQRLKENIQDADSASSLIDSLQVRQFDWKTDNTHQRYGFVAQEIVSVVPEAVHQPADPDEMMAVDYSKLVPMLVKEIQSLRIRIAQLESK